MRIATVAFFAMAVLSAEAAFVDGEKRFIVGDVPEHTTGAYRPFTIPGEISADDGMVEFRKGRGIAVWCPEKVLKESPRKAEAAKRFVASPFLPVKPLAVGYVGNAAGEALLRDLGVKFASYGVNNIWQIDINQVLVLGPGTGETFKTDAQRDSLRKRLSGRLVVVLPGADLALLPQPVSRKDEPLDAKDATVPDLPVFSGTAGNFREFLDRAKGTSAPVVANGPGWTKATKPACFALVKNRDQSIVILNLAPSSVPEAARPALTRVWCTMFANMNIDTGHGLPPGI